MSYRLSIIAAATLMIGGVRATAAELPSYELTGFPISPHQFSVVGSANVKEQSPSSSLAMAGMPASPPPGGRPDAARETNRGAGGNKIRLQRLAPQIAKKEACGADGPNPDLLGCGCTRSWGVHPQQCDSGDARADRFGNPSTCFMHAQTYLAQTSFQQDLGPNDRVKIICVRSETVAVSETGLDDPLAALARLLWVVCHEYHRSKR